MDRQEIISDVSGKPQPLEIASLFPAGLFDQDFEKKRPVTATISLPIEQVFAFLRDFSNHALFMKGVRKVKSKTDRIAQWTADTDAGSREWETAVVEERPNQLVAWKTAEDGDFKYTGAFALVPATGGRGTIVAFKLATEKPLSKISDSLSKFILKDMDSQSYTCLRRLKALLETGEIPSTEGQPSGREDDAELKH